MVLVIEPKSTIGRLVARPPVWVEETISIGDVARVMRDADVSSVLVGAGGAIITERDVARAVAAGVELAGPALTMASRHPGTDFLLKCAVGRNRPPRLAR